MGCFLSKKQPTKPENKKYGGASPPPPPQPPEEEAVKEVVLSETPIFLKPTLIEDTVWDNKKPPGNHELKVETPAEITQNESSAEFKPCEDFISEVSEQSELCSYTDSFSTTTTATATAPEKRDDGEEVTQRSPLKPRRKRPNNGDMVVGARERNVRSPPARRQAPSPEKRKPVQGRGMPGPRRIIGPRREGGEVSARRSRSPVTRGNVMYKTPAGMIETGRTAARSPARAVENSHRPAKAVENSGGKSEVQSDGDPGESSKVEKQNEDKVGVRESLENPLVSGLGSSVPLLCLICLSK